MLSLNPILSMPRPVKRVISVGVDTLFIICSFWGAFYFRLGSIKPYVLDSYYWHILTIIVLLTLVMFIKTGLYRAILRYLSLHAVMTIAFVAMLSGFTVILSAYYFQLFLPRSVPVMYAAFLAVLCGGSRLLVRYLVSDLLIKNRTPVIIYGAGSAGRQLNNVLLQSRDIKVVAFIDDNRKLHKSTIQGVTIFRRKYLSHLISKYHVTRVLLAMPSASRNERKSIIELLSSYSVEVQTIPNLDDIVNGELLIDQLKEVAIEDLLGRDQVKPEQALLEQNNKHKVVMVTGAGGSIGSELCRQIIQFKPTVLVLFELSEFSLYRIDRELNAQIKEQGLKVKIIPIMGNVQNQLRLEQTMNAYRVNTVYHAAAYKHVPLVEYNVAEGVNNNVFGTYHCAKAAIAANIESFVLISTDKAVRPTNVMGTTKRLAELGLQALAKGYQKEHQTLFSMVRFGNVLGSSGSVIPLFKTQIANGGPVTVTHKDIIRYFMTIPEAAQLVIQAGAMAKGGDVFVLDMGEPVRIKDLASNLIHLSGLEVKNEQNPEGDIEILYTGLRPGEKLFEELLIGDSVTQTSHDRIMTTHEVSIKQHEYQKLFDDLYVAAKVYDHERLRQIMLEAPTGFAPTDNISDLVWLQAQSMDKKSKCSYSGQHN